MDDFQDFQDFQEVQGFLQHLDEDNPIEQGFPTCGTGTTGGTQTGPRWYAEFLK